MALAQFSISNLFRLQLRFHINLRVAIRASGRLDSIQRRFSTSIQHFQASHFGLSKAAHFEATAAPSTEIIIPNHSMLGGVLSRSISHRQEEQELGGIYTRGAGSLGEAAINLHLSQSYPAVSYEAGHSIDSTVPVFAW